MIDMTSLFYNDLDSLRYAVMGEVVDIAFVFSFSFDQSLTADCGDILVGCHVTKRKRMALRHKLLFLAFLIDSDLDLECLALLQNQFLQIQGY